MLLNILAINFVLEVIPNDFCVKNDIPIFLISIKSDFNSMLTDKT
jgi:hypothetical protein